ncbi:MAG: transcription regulator of the Arc/MetJ class [Proteobacteria bacterium SG_bin5]|nr:type II toxin-antitoxin system VapB family antitoxin [Sphingomonas sp.]OQW41200.1 MAG: transcription regulator of the Arc/MetJ class [Proteobacteria bacterium SG_bin5]
MHLIPIDDALLASARAASSASSDMEAVIAALEQAIRLRQQAEIRGFRGKLHWTGDLDAMRLDRS